VPWSRPERAVDAGMKLNWVLPDQLGNELGNGLHLSLMATKRIEVEAGTGNVFADLGYSDAKERTLKVELANAHPGAGRGAARNRAAACFGPGAISAQPVFGRAPDAVPHASRQGRRDPDRRAAGTAFARGRAHSSRDLSRVRSGFAWRTASSLNSGEERGLLMDTSTRLLNNSPGCARSLFCRMEQHK